MNIYKYIDYKRFVVDFVEKAKLVHKKFTYSQVADALGVQKTYVSKVLKGDAQFSTDQAYLLAEYFRLDDEEQEYLLLLLELSRTSLAKRKTKLRKQIKSVQARHHKTEKYIEAERVEQTDFKFAAYYLNPMLPLIHQMLFLARYQKNPDLLARQLDMQTEVFEQALVDLEKLGFIKKLPKGELLMDRPNIQLTPESPICAPHQSLMRMKSIDQMSRLLPKQKYSFSATFTSNDAVSQKIQHEFLEFLKLTEKLVRDSKRESCYQMNFDLFPWEVERHKEK